jgi:aminoglycoside 6'-N-acetyltransferase I
MIKIRSVTPEDHDEWLRLRYALWPGPHHSIAELETELSEIQADPIQPVFVAAQPDGGLCGMIEVSIRKEAEGCTTDRIGYIEGWYVDPEFREQGIGGRLVQAAESWARSQGCVEMASDTTLTYPLSPKAHEKLGYKEVQRSIHFAKKL